MRQIEETNEKAAKSLINYKGDLFDKSAKNIRLLILASEIVEQNSSLTNFLFQNIKKTYASHINN